MSVTANGLSRLESDESIKVSHTVSPSFLEYFKNTHPPPPHLSLMGSSVNIFFTKFLIHFLCFLFGHSFYDRLASFILHIPILLEDNTLFYVAYTVPLSFWYFVTPTRQTAFSSEIYSRTLNLCFSLTTLNLKKKSTINFIMVNITRQQLHLASFHKCAQSFKLVETL